MDKIPPKLESTFEAMVLAPIFSSFEQGLGPIGSTAFEGVLAQVLDRGDG